MGSKYLRTFTWLCVAIEIRSLHRIINLFFIFNSFYPILFPSLVSYCKQASIILFKGEGKKPSFPRTSFSCLYRPGMTLDALSIIQGRLLSLVLARPITSP